MMLPTTMILIASRRMKTIIGEKSIPHVNGNLRLIGASIGSVIL
jgi:hypothetical protein